MEIIRTEILGEYFESFKNQLDQTKTESVLAFTEVGEWGTTFWNYFEYLFAKIAGK